MSRAVPFRIAIGPRQEPGPFPVRVKYADQEFDTQIELSDDLLALGQSLLAAYATVVLADPEAIGKQLGRALFIPRLRGALLEQARLAAQTGARLQLQLQIGVPELAALPWEWLTLAGSRPWVPALREDYTLIRIGRQAIPAAPIVVEGPLQLLAIAGAGQTAQLDALQAALDGPLREQRIVLDLISNASLLDLREALDAQQYHILHIAAAISISPDQELMVALGRGCEAFDLAELLANYPTLRLVTLSGAQGDGLHASATPALLGAILMTEQIPAAVTIGWDLAPESSARALAMLYDGLAAEAPLDLAATAGRRVLQQEGEAGWGALQVRSLPGADQLFVLRPARPTATQFEARRILPYAIAALVLVLLIVVGRALFGGTGTGNLPNSSTTATAVPNGFVLPLFPGQPPTPTPPAATPTLEALPEPQGYVIATVSFSDTLERLANQYASQPRGIAELNSLPITETLRVGRGLVIPVYQSGATNVGGLIVARGNPKQPNVALTFDIELDQEVLLKILDLLAARQIRATFFVTGSWVEAYPNAARAIVQAGHELGNHSYSHPYFSRLADEGAQNEIEETERIVREITGATTRPYFRFPYGDSTEDMLVLLGQEGYIAYHWSTDEAGMEQWLSQAAADPSSANGAILLMHGRADVVNALNGWLDRIETLGFRVTTLSETLR
ncbi:MAG: hypothetical protein OHK0050_39460 [Roseiflexaceae bacterium]